MDIVLQEHPKDVVALSARALCNRKLRKYANAVNDCTLALNEIVHQIKDRHDSDGSPKHVSTSPSLTNSPVHMNVSKDKKQLYGEEYLCRLYNSRAYCYAKQSEYENALADYQAALLLNPNDTHALHNSGVSCDRLGRYAEAIKEFSKVIELDPDNSNAYFSRGGAYDSLNKFDLALADYTIALSLKGKSDSVTNSSIAAT